MSRRDATIKVSMYVKRRLDEIKAEEGHKSYDSVIRMLIASREASKR